MHFLSLYQAHARQSWQDANEIKKNELWKRNVAHLQSNTIMCGYLNWMWHQTCVCNDLQLHQLCVCVSNHAYDIDKMLSEYTGASIFHQSIYSPGMKWAKAKGQPHFHIALSLSLSPRH